MGTSNPAALLGLLPFLFGPPAVSQEIPVTRLSQTDAVSGRGFTKLVGIRELRDGRVIVVDEIERAVLILDPDLAGEHPIGRSGSGPGEFVVPSELFSLVGDSSAVMDDPNNRLLVLGPEGEPAGVANRVEGGDWPPQASDGYGHFYTWRRVGDSAAIVRWDFGSPTSDTVAFLPPAGDRRTSQVGGITVTRAEDMNPFPPRSLWVVDRDGRVAVVHPEPYRVVLFENTGATHHGPVIPVDPVRVTEEHKERWREEMARPRTQVRVVRGGGRSYVTARGPDFEPADWPRHLPPFLRDAARFGPDGRLWVQRTTPADAPPSFDLFDPEGLLVEKVALPRGRRLIGFGKESVYAVWRDEFDLEYPERYAMAPGSKGTGFQGG